MIAISMKFGTIQMGFELCCFWILLDRYHFLTNITQLSLINQYLINVIINSSLVKNGIDNQHEWNKRLEKIFSKSA